MACTLFSLSDIDECADSRLHSCTASTTCVNTQGSYTCSCAEGFESTKSGKTIGKDIECQGRLPNVYLCFPNSHNQLSEKIYCQWSIANQDAFNLSLIHGPIIILKCFFNCNQHSKCLNCNQFLDQFRLLTEILCHWATGDQTDWAIS